MCLVTIRAICCDVKARSRPAVRWSQERRLEFIDARLCWDGRLNRSDLCESFGISVPQASVDIARYIELAPGNLAYDKRTRSYLAEPRFRPAFSATGVEQFLRGLVVESELAGPSAVPFAAVPVPGRRIDLAVLRPLWRAIREGTGLRVTYQSLTHAQPQERTLTPHALAHDGYRWHVRAYCHTRKAFRDFVIARVQKVLAAAEAGRSAADDHDWNTYVTLVLAPHPKLGAAHRRAIELDYGMVKGRVGLKCRKALVFYTLHHLRLDERIAISPEAQQVVLKNAAQIADLGLMARAVASPVHLSR